MGYITTILINRAKRDFCQRGNRRHFYKRGEAERAHLQGEGKSARKARKLAKLTKDPAHKVFAQMKSSHEYFGVVMDEYGGMAGIVTMYDLLEAIVGDMNEKNEEIEYTVKKVNDAEWEINGLAPFGKVEDALGISVRVEDGDYETFSGYVYSLLDTLPEDNTQCEVETAQLFVCVTKVEKHCITQMRVTVKPVDEEEEDED